MTPASEPEGGGPPPPPDAGTAAGAPGTVRLSGFLLCDSVAQSDLVRRHLPEHHRLTTAEPGCLSFEVVPTADPLVWRVAECFADRAAFEHHQSRTRASAWWSATAAIARDYEISGLTPD